MKLKCVSPFLGGMKRKFCKHLSRTLRLADERGVAAGGLKNLVCIIAAQIMR